MAALVWRPHAPPGPVPAQRPQGTLSPRTNRLVRRLRPTSRDPADLRLEAATCRGACCWRTPLPQCSRQPARARPFACMLSPVLSDPGSISAWLRARRACLKSGAPSLVSSGLPGGRLPLSLRRYGHAHPPCYRFPPLRRGPRTAALDVAQSSVGRGGQTRRMHVPCALPARHVQHLSPCNSSPRCAHRPRAPAKDLFSIPRAGRRRAPPTASLIAQSKLAHFQPINSCQRRLCEPRKLAGRSLRATTCPQALKALRRDGLTACLPISAWPPQIGDFRAGPGNGSMAAPHQARQMHLAHTAAGRPMLAARWRGPAPGRRASVVARAGGRPGQQYPWDESEYSQ